MERVFIRAIDEATTIAVASITDTAYVNRDGYTLTEYAATVTRSVKSKGAPQDHLVFYVHGGTVGRHTIDSGEPRFALGAQYLLFLQECPNGTNWHLDPGALYTRVEGSKCTTRFARTPCSTDSLVEVVSARLAGHASYAMGASSDAVLLGRITYIHPDRVDVSFSQSPGVFGLHVSGILRTRSGTELANGQSLAVRYQKADYRPDGVPGSMPSMAVDDSVVVFLSQVNGHWQLPPTLYAYQVIENDIVVARALDRMCRTSNAVRIASTSMASVTQQVQQ